MLNGSTPLDPPVIPSLITPHEMHCAALRMKTIVRGTVARFKGMYNFRWRGGSLEIGIGGKGRLTSLMTKIVA